MHVQESPFLYIIRLFQNTFFYTLYAISTSDSVIRALVRYLGEPYSLSLTTVSLPNKDTTEMWIREPTLNKFLLKSINPISVKLSFTEKGQTSVLRNIGLIQGGALNTTYSMFSFFLNNNCVFLNNQSMSGWSPVYCVGNI